MLHPDPLELVISAIPSLPQQYYRLILVVGAHGSGKTRLLKALCRRQAEPEAIPYLNLNLELSRQLLDLTTSKRPLRVRPILGQILDAQPVPVLALDNIELLFDPGLHQDPLALLKELSRNKSLIVAWGGTFEREHQILTYAKPGHPEYRRYERPEVQLIVLSKFESISKF